MAPTHAMTPQEIAVAIVEDQKPLRDGLAALISGTAGFGLAGAFGSMEDALAKVAARVPDVALVDIGLPGMSGIEGVRRLKERSPALQILILTVFSDNDHIFEAICAGASGYLLKDTPPARLLDAIREVTGGGAPMSPEIARKVISAFRATVTPRDGETALSERENAVLRLLAEGQSYKTAAAALGISPDTVRFHVRNIYDKLHVHSKSEAVLKAFRAGLLS